MSLFDLAASYAQSMLDKRAEQDKLFDVPLRGTLGWDVLLVLFVADAKGVQLTGREAIDGAGLPLEVGRRWLTHLSHAGLILGDGKLEVDVVVTLAPRTITRLEQYIEGCLVSGVRFYPR